MKNTIVRHLLLYVSTALILLSCRKAPDTTIITESHFEGEVISSIEARNGWSITIENSADKSGIMLEYTAFLEEGIIMSLNDGKLILDLQNVSGALYSSTLHATIYSSQLSSLSFSNNVRTDIIGEFCADSVIMALSRNSSCRGGRFISKQMSVVADKSDIADIEFVGERADINLVASRMAGRINATTSQDINLDGSSFVNYSGQTLSVRLAAKNASIANTVSNEAAVVLIELEGGSTITANVIDSISGYVKEGSSLYYVGNPTLNLDVDESSSVKRL